MLNYFKAASIRTKIITLVLVISGVVVVFSASWFVLSDFSQYKNREISSTAILAKILGANNEVALTFSDEQFASENVRSMRAAPDIRMVLVQTYNPTTKNFADTTLAIYQRNEEPFSIKNLPLGKSDTTFIYEGYIVAQSVVLYKSIHTSDIIGRVVIIKDIDFATRIKQFIFIILLILLASSLLTFILAYYFERYVSGAIIHLHSVVKRISHEKDFSLRAKPETSDEVGQLTEVFNDMISQIEIQNKELQSANEQALQSLKIKEQFLANMSHEIRTPMNAVLGFTELLLGTNLTVQQVDYLHNIKVSAENLLVIINDILDFSKMEAGRIELEKIDFNLRNLLEQLRKTLNYEANKKNLDLTVFVEENVPTTVIGDPVRISQILTNLISNSLKFTHEGGVSIHVSVIGIDKEIYHIKFSVSDTGIGIDNSKLDKIFESFNQESSSTTRKYGGTGLGLTISKQLVELQGGQISVSSVVGEGSVFSFILPLSKSQKTIQNEIPNDEDDNSLVISASVTKDIRVLLAEDNKINQIFALTLLRNFNFQADIANDGMEVIEKHSLNEYDIILMDLHMPRMDGYEATVHIRTKMPENKRNIPIIALTAAATRAEVDNCMQIGMNEFISKPFKANELVKKIINLAKSTSTLELEDEMKTDLTYLESMSGGNPEVIKEMIELFKEQIPEYKEEMRKSLDTKNWKALSEIAHKSKSSLNIFGMADLAKKMQTLEHLAKEGKDPELYESLVNDFATEVDEAMAELINELKL